LNNQTGSASGKNGFAYASGTATGYAPRTRRGVASNGTLLRVTISLSLPSAPPSPNAEVYDSLAVDVWPVQALR